MTAAVALRASAPEPAIAIVTPDEDDATALIALINVLAGERSQLFIQPVDPASGIAGLRAHLAAIASSGTEAVLVARDGKEMVGLVTGTRGAHPVRRGVVEIGIGVRASHRGRGIGSALLASLERWAHARGCHRLQLRVVTTNAPAIALYRKAGFVVEGELKATALVDGQPLDELQMGKLLGPTA